jgi:hypothetical protein
MAVRVTRRDLGHSECEPPEDPRRSPVGARGRADSGARSRPSPSAAARLHATLSALRMLADRGVAGPVTAVVTVADDGARPGACGASWSLLPPGDLRMALAALAGEQLRSARPDRPRWHRRRTLDPPPAASLGAPVPSPGMPSGNLLLAGLMEVLDDP